MKNKNLTIITIFSKITLSLTCLIAIDNFTFAQTPTINLSTPTTASSKNQSQIVIADHIYTTLRKDNSLFDLQKNITIPAGKDMTYVDITTDGKIVAATSS